MKVLVTGGAGYIGSHTCVELLKSGIEILVYDNLSSGSRFALQRVESITKKKVKLVIGDILDQPRLLSAFLDFEPDAVIHFAGLKSVKESIKNPLEYYKVNVTGSLNLISIMEKTKCNLIIFSSSATVYGNPKYLPIDEKHPTNPITPYGKSKLMTEHILKSWVDSNPKNSAICLRYFNPVGAHESGLIGENPNKEANNLMPVIVEVAAGQRSELFVFGHDYSTRDGTGERDYIHVSDLALGHILALENYAHLNRCQILNLGTGAGTTVLELVREFESSNSISIPLKEENRRSGDVSAAFADPTLANNLINFLCQRKIPEMCQDSWNWKRLNPYGYTNI